MYDLIKEINDIIEKNNSKINENLVGINYLEKLKYLVISNLKEVQDKFAIDNLVVDLKKENNQLTKNGFIGKSTQAYKRVYPKIAAALVNGDEVVIHFV